VKLRRKQFNGDREAFDAIEGSARGLWARYRACTRPEQQEEARWDLVRHYLPLANRAGLSYASSTRMWDRPVDQDDMVQDLVIVLHELVEAYDPYQHSGVPFHKFAAHRLRLRAGSCAMQYDFVGRGGRAAGFKPPAFTSIDADRGDEGHSILSQLVACAAGDDVTAERRYRRWAASKIPDRKLRTIALLRWWRGWSQEQIAARCGRTRSWVSLQQTKILRLLLAGIDRPDLIGVSPTAFHSHDARRLGNGRGARRLAA
jgi:hypothetical protein